MAQENPGVFRSEDIREVVISHEGKDYTFKLRELGWSDTNKLISKSTSYTADRKGVFDLDTYYREALMKMVVESPWGPMTHQLLVKLSPAFGAKLEALVPLPGGEIGPFVPEPKTLETQ